MPAAKERRPISARFYPHQLEKLKAITVARAAEGGEPLSVNEVIVALVEEESDRIQAKSSKASKKRKPPPG